MTTRCCQILLEAGKGCTPRRSFLFGLTFLFTLGVLPLPAYSQSLEQQELTLKRRISDASSRGDVPAQCRWQSEIAIVYAGMKKLPEGFRAARWALKTAGQNHLELAQARAYASLGYLYEVSGDDARSFESFLEADYRMRSYLDPRLSFWIHYHLGNLQYRAENFDESRTQMRLALNEYNRAPESFTHDQDLLSAYNTIALNYRKQGRYDSAIFYHKKCMHLAQQRNAAFWEQLSRGNIGIAMVGQSRYDSAFDFITSDLAISLKNHEWRSAAVDHVYLGEILDHRNALAQAQQHFDAAHALMTRKKITLLNYFSKASEHYRYLKDYRKSQEHLARYIRLRDSLQIQKNSKQLVMAQLRNEFDKKLLEVALVVKDNELKSVQLKIHRITLAVSLVATAVAVLLMFRLYRRSVSEKRLKKMLEEKVRKRTWRLAKVNRELDTFIYRSSHDLRRPLTTLIGLDNLGQIMVKDETARELLKKVGETARGMDHMLTKLRYIHELNQRARQPVVCNLSDIVMEEVGRLQAELEKNNISVSTSFTFHHMLKTDPDILRVIVNNLLENAIQFRQLHSENHIRLNTGSLEGNYCYLEVADTGIGIDKEIAERIYTPFFRGSEYSRGSGLGLFLVKNAVDALKGKISLESQFGKGSRFTVAIPVEL